MKKASFGLPVALLLSAGLAGLVSACYFPRFVPGAGDLYVVLDRTDIVLTYRPHSADMVIITAELRPSVAVGEGATVMWEWATSNSSAVDFLDHATVKGRYHSTATVMAWGPGEARVVVRVTVGGARVDATGRVYVRGP